uniref:Integrin subunit alpha 8 n=1 Tax=Callorhinchus milii TaxID=7868 RepID=A0A4W3HP43_CALMI
MPVAGGWCQAGMYLFGCLLLVLSPGCVSFNLDTESPTLYSGPRGSYFGYSVDFYSPDHRTVNVLVGAPKANTSQPGIVEGGAVYYCKWPAGGTTCTEIPFDKSSNRKIKITQEPVEFKSNQWFGATVRSYNEKVVACAPLYHWRALKVTQEKDPVGTCYVAVQNFSTYAEYSPCRSDNADPEGQGVCQAGFSLDFTQVSGSKFSWILSVFTAGVVEILDGYDFRALIRKVKGERQTGVAPAEYDDSFLVGWSGQPPAGFHAPVQALLQHRNYFNYHLLYLKQKFTIALFILHRLDDVLVGAPLFMDRESDGKLKEVGQVYLFLQEEAFQFQDPQKLLGTDVFGRYGSAIASLADLNHDGYNDIAIGVPFAGDDGRGKVLIYNGQSTGLNPKPSQVLEEQWSSQAIPSGFGFTLRGASDIDRNDYPDLIVGAFGASKVVVYRARPVVTVHAQLQLNPSIINPENKSCILPESESLVSCFTVEVCATISGHAIPYIVVLNVDLHLDKLKKKGVVERILFLYYHQPQHSFQLVVGKSQHSRCKEFVVYLTDEKEFRDKLTPIGVNLNYSLDESRPLEGLAVKPILNYYTALLSLQAHILLDCGDDNLCIPMLKLSASPDRQQLIIGDEIPLTLIINAKNEGEGAYEAELYVTIPPESDYIGVIRNNELSCAYKVDNSTQMVVCDLGNPMVAGTNLSVGLRFSVQRLEKADASIRFDLQIKSSNKDNPDSNTVQLQIDITAVAHVNVWGVSHPEQIVLPMTNWESKDKPKKEEDVGPLVQHVYELHNSGPSTISDAVMEVGWPSRYREEYLLYILQIQTDGPLYCWINATINPLQLEVGTTLLYPSTISHLITRREVRLPQPLKRDPTKILNCSNIECTKIYCRVGQLEKRQSAVLKVRSRLWIQTFLKVTNNLYYSVSNCINLTAVIWATPDASLSIPLWVIILAVLVGLLVLAILILVMWKFGFFDRARPPQDDMTDREQLNPEKATEA